MNKDKKTIRILYLIQSGKPGGAEISTLLLLRHLDKDHFSPLVVVPQGSLVESEFRRQGIQTIGMTLPQIKSFNPLRIIWSFILLLKGALKIRNIVRNYGIDVIQSMSNKRTAAFGIVAARIARTPSVLTLRVIDYVKIVDDLLLRWATKVIAISDAVAKVHLRGAGLNGKLVTVYNAVDINEFDPTLNDTKPLRAVWGIKATEFVVGITSRLSPEKGHEYFLEAASKVLAKIPTIKFVVVGDLSFYGDKSYYYSLRALSERLCIDDSVKFVGYENNIAAIMSSIDVLTLCCANEPFGRVVIEAMAMKKPVISFDSGGPREIVVHNKTGFLVPLGDIDSLADSILVLYRDQDLRKRMGEFGRKEVLEKFSIEKHVGSYQRIYQELVARKYDKQD
jgi:glycosyltransferase involved in cell wall biosynthesis